MSRETFFHRVSARTPTRFWINNPTDEEARLAIANGAIHCTTNPTYAGKMLCASQMREIAQDWLCVALSQTADMGEAASIVQRLAVRRLADIFLPLFERTGGQHGFVSIQIDPYREEEPENIVREALADRQIGPNVIAKIPVTYAGLAAISELVKRNIPIIATEIMSISQAEAACETYREAARASRCTPPFFVTCIAGIFDDYLRLQYEAGKIHIDPDVLFQAGTVLTKRQYRLMKQRCYPGILLGGGARGQHHFTEFIGGAMHVTINWRNCAEDLICSDAPVISRMDSPVPDYVLDELMQAAPDFRRAYNTGEIDPVDFSDYGPVKLFRDQFIAGWDLLLNEIRAFGRC